jgi:hypothetical protein
MKISAALLLVLVVGLFGQERSRPKPFIVRMSEVHSTQQATAGPMNWSNCLIVMPDGRVHLELQRQELFGNVELTAFESALDSKEIGFLRNILDDGGIIALPSFPPPVKPMDVDDWQVFTAEIVRETQMQRVGYLSWHGSGPNNPETDKKAWREADDKLQRLVAWSHEIKSRRPLTWRQVAKPKAWCGD